MLSCHKGMDNVAAEEGDGRKSEATFETYSLLCGVFVNSEHEHLSITLWSKVTESTCEYCRDELLSCGLFERCSRTMVMKWRPVSKPTSLTLQTPSSTRSKNSLCNWVMIQVETLLSFRFGQLLGKSGEFIIVSASKNNTGCSLPRGHQRKRLGESPSLDDIKSQWSKGIIQFPSKIRTNLVCVERVELGG